MVASGVHRIRSQKRQFLVLTSRLQAATLASMLERTIVAKVLKVAKSLGWFAVKIHGSAYQMAGLPDILAIKAGRAVWLEVKVSGNKPSAIQLRRIKELAAAGCSCAVVYSADEARTFLEVCV